MNRQRQDRKILKNLLRLLDRKKAPSPPAGELALEIGKCFLGTPYRSGTLESKGPEHLVVNLKEFDCFTFVENVTALVCLLTSPQNSFDAFRRILRKIRYRQGRVQGYPSRLHYFSDWIHDNQKKSFRHRCDTRSRREAVEEGDQLHDDPSGALSPSERIRRTFEKCSQLNRRSAEGRCLSFQRKGVRGLEARIRDGDLIAIMTTTEGLDVQHVGLAVRVRNRVHLLHASSVEGKVILSKETLYRYLIESNTRSGIMVARIAQGKTGLIGKNFSRQ